jgi:hypothetical protein
MMTRGPSDPLPARRSPTLVNVRVASMPSISGIRMSINTTSGARRAATSTASAPSADSPTTSMSAWVSRIIRKPARTSA